MFNIMCCIGRTTSITNSGKVSPPAWVTAPISAFLSSYSSGKLRWIKLLSVTLNNFLKKKLESCQFPVLNTMLIIPKDKKIHLFPEDLFL
jgi:hypothetical protein